MGEEGAEDQSPGAHGTDGTRRRKSTQSKGNQQSPKNDADDIKNIRQCKNYYEILGVAQDCSEEDLKRAYKKLALKYHPDKNSTPGATEAFKAISNAFSVLNDAEKRRRYDQYGSEEEQAVQRQGEYDFTRGGFQGDVSAEDLFNMFFGSGFQMGPGVRTYYTPGGGRAAHYHYQRFHQRQQHHQQDDEEGVGLHRLIPLLIIIVIMALTNLMRNDPYYSLQYTSKYNTVRRTSGLDVPYYVKPDFGEKFQGSVSRLEAQVEEDYIANLRHSCRNERIYKESLFWQAKSYGNARLYEEAQATETPSCDKLQHIYGG